MRHPIAPLTPKAIKPVQGKPDTPAREGLQGSRSFAELLAEAEAVQDHIQIASRATARTGLPGALQSAAEILVRQAPWLGLPLLLRQGPVTDGTDRPPSRERRKS